MFIVAAVFGVLAALTLGSAVWSGEFKPGFALGSVWLAISSAFMAQGVRLAREAQREPCAADPAPRG